MLDESAPIGVEISLADATLPCESNSRIKKQVTEHLAIKFSACKAMIFALQACIGLVNCCKASYFIPRWWLTALLRDVNAGVLTPDMLYQ